MTIRAFFTNVPRVLSSSVEGVGSRFVRSLSQMSQLREEATVARAKLSEIVEDSGSFRVVDTDRLSYPMVTDSSLTCRIESAAARSMIQQSERNPELDRVEIREPELDRVETREASRSPALDVGLLSPKNPAELLTFGVKIPLMEDLEAAKGNLAQVLGSTIKTRIPPSLLSRLISSTISGTPADIATAMKVVEGLFGENLSITTEIKEPITSLLKRPQEIRDIADIHRENQVIQLRRREFRGQLKTQIQEFERVRESEDCFKATDVLRKWIFSGSRDGVKRFNYEELSKIFRKLHNLGEYDMMVEVMENSQNQAFKKDPVNLEFYCRANLKSSYCNPTYVEAVATFMERSIGPNAEIKCIMGMLNATRANIAKILMEDLQKGRPRLEIVRCFTKFIPEVDPLCLKDIQSCYQQYLRASLDCYEKAFMDSHDPRYGLRVVHRLLAEDYLSGKQSDELMQFVRLTHVSTHVADGANSKSFSVVQSLLETQLILDPTNMVEFAKYGIKLVEVCQSSALTKNAILSLMEIMSFSHDPEVIRKTDMLLGILKHKYQALNGEKDQLSLQEYQNILLTSEPRATPLLEVSEQMHRIAHEWEAASFSYRDIRSNYIRSNFHFFEQSSLQNINKTDLCVFNQIIQLQVKDLLPGSADTRRLCDITDTNEFLTISDQMIREHFQTDKLEEVYSEGRRTYDTIVEKAHWLSGASAIEDVRGSQNSRTNISMAFALGLGDSTNHAQVKQLLFNTWQVGRINLALAEYDAAVLAQAPETIVLEKQQRIESLLGEKLKTVDIGIYLPVVMEEVTNESGAVSRKPKVDSKGRYIYDEAAAGSGRVEKVDTHTMNILLRYEDYKMGKIRTITKADSFYQTRFPFGSGDIDTSRSLKDGVEVGMITMVKEDGSEIPVPTVIKPAAISQKGEYDKGDATIQFMGLMTGLPSTEVLALIQNMDRKAEILAKIQSVSLH